MALAAIDECIRNLVCVGADPLRIALLDNFCWPGCDDPERLGGLVRAAEGCHDGAIAYRAPFISGKDSLNNQFTTEDGRTIRIPPTLLISGFGPVADCEQAVTMDAKEAGHLLVLVGDTTPAMGGSHWAMARGRPHDARLPLVDLEQGPMRARGVHALIRAGVVHAAHDPSEGGLLVAAAEMAIAGELGLELDFTLLPGIGPVELAFAETPGRYLLEMDRDDLYTLGKVLEGVPHAIVGEFNGAGRLTLAGHDLDVPVAELERAWSSTLSW
jgi:phosphoribosylformylglycinamidine synthase